MAKVYFAQRLPQETIDVIHALAEKWALKPAKVITRMAEIVVGIERSPPPKDARRKTVRALDPSVVLEKTKRAVAGRTVESHPVVSKIIVGRGASVRQERAPMFKPNGKL